MPRLLSLLVCVCGGREDYRGTGREWTCVCVCVVGARERGFGQGEGMKLMKVSVREGQGRKRGEIHMEKEAQGVEDRRNIVENGMVPDKALWSPKMIVFPLRLKCKPAR
ncbi:hypothetical protein PoB_001119200 [Plakobranchus ocellatus]|uniref:Secreted protein n=1 Tax=Plakobranchus ocellatus TaxID=259542 RepID=A0AAV3YQE5_9GAST|nr:hypothetical protein PoB_001119200 [Plakobranchus ocellatus]